MAHTRHRGCIRRVLASAILDASLVLLAACGGSINCTDDSECMAAVGRGSCCVFMSEDDVGWVCYPAHSSRCR